MKQPRYQVVNLNVRISTCGRGLTTTDIEKLCSKLQKVCQGRSKNHDVSVVA